MKIVRRVLQVVLPFAFVAAGVFGVKKLMESAPRTQRKAPPTIVPMVEVITAQPKPHHVVVRAMGRIVPAQVMVVQPEVTGRVTYHSPNLVLGGRIEAGEVLVRIDPRDYRLAVKQQRANVARAKMELKIEAGRRRIATREWKLFRKKAKAGALSSELALRKPQELAAKASLVSAKSGLQRARLAAGKTTISASMNAVVREEAAEIGQLVGPASRLATLVGTDVYWVKVAIPVDRLSKIKIPGVRGETKGAKVKVIQALGQGKRVTKSGQVVRLLADLERVGKMAQLLVSVADPLGTLSGGLPLILGATVTVEIEGPKLPDTVTLPRNALRNEREVWLVSAEGKLLTRKITIGWREPTRLYVSGLSSGARVITSPLPSAVEGMALKIRLVDGQAKPATAELEPRKAP